MIKLFLVASGGAFGALLRYSMSNFLKLYFYNNFYSTLTINVIGSFLIGYLISIGNAKNLSENFIKYFLIIGFLGSFTTFSAFSYEVVELLLTKKILLSISYIIFSIILCIVAAYFGMYINKIWLKI